MLLAAIQEQLQLIPLWQSSSCPQSTLLALISRSSGLEPGASVYCIPKPRVRRNRQNVTVNRQRLDRHGSAECAGAEQRGCRMD